MSYTWQTEKTDWNATDYYNYTDANRVDNNTRYLQEYINTNLGYIITLDAYTTQTVNSYPTYVLINLLEHNINLLKTVIDTPTNWVDLWESWSVSNNTFTYIDANNLEVDLNLLKETFMDIFSGLRYSGTFICGESNDRLISY